MVEVKRIFDLLPHLQRTCRNKARLFSWQVESSWIPVSLPDYIRTSTALCHVFKTLGYKQGDRAMTIISNRPDWNYIDMGLMKAGIIHIPVYPTLSRNSFKHIIQDSMPRIIIVEDPVLASAIQEFTGNLEFDVTVYCMHATNGIKHYNELLDTGLKLYYNDIEQDTDNIDPDSVATILYTSGTTGKPKGVMLTHRNIVSNFLAISPISGYGPAQTAMSFLPLCHIYERTLNYMYQYLGMTICYVAPALRASELIREIRPHVFCAVPRFIEKAWDRFLDAGYRQPIYLRLLFRYAVQFAGKYDLQGNNSLWYLIQLRLLRSLVFKKFRRAMGGRLEIIVSGSAALHPQLTQSFWAAGIKVIEGYGLTETAPVIAVNRINKGLFRLGTVGPLLDEVDVKIDQEGEILCKGPNVMKGYWNNQELTDEVIDDEGWLHTGDIGEWVDDRFIRIIDRKKELIKTSGGKYISPQQIEALFGQSTFFDQIMVVGEGRNFPAAVISPDFRNLHTWCKNNHIDVSIPLEILGRSEVRQLLFNETEKYNKYLGQFEKIKRFLFVTETWDPATGELSPTLKLRRNLLAERYQKAIGELYDDSSYQ